MSLKWRSPPRYNELPADLTEHDRLSYPAGAGSLLLARIPGWNPEELDSDLAALSKRGVTVLVSLVPDSDLDYSYAAGGARLPLYERAKHQPFRTRRFPIPNLGVPDVLADFASLVEEIYDEVTAGGTVAVHCVAGLGRTGLTGACLLVRFGVRATDAIPMLRRARPGSIETEDQESYVRTYENLLRGRNVIR